MTNRDILTLVLFLFLFFRLFRLILKMKQPTIFPVTEEDLQAIRVQPKKVVELPMILRQKTGLIWLGIYLLLMLIGVIYNLLRNYNISFVIIPLYALFTFKHAWNLFAFVQNGVLCEGRFVPWKRIHSYHFEEVDENHHFYGYSPEVNSGYELWIMTKYSEVSCIVTSEAVKEKLTELLDANLKASKIQK